MADSDDSAVLGRLYATIEARKDADPETSYTARLFARGPEKIAQKLGEEAVEAVIAAAAGRRGEIVAESADLLFHLMVAWAKAGVAPGEVWAELARREGVSGLAEKRGRKTDDTGGRGSDDGL